MGARYECWVWCLMILLFYTAKGRMILFLKKIYPQNYKKLKKKYKQAGTQSQGKFWLSEL